MKIIELKAENVKKLKAVEIRPDGDVVVIGGNNAEGKSSVLDSIYMALGGKKALGVEPVRKGTHKAVIECDMGELMVKRTITPSGGGSLKVTNSDGLSYDSPQKILDALTSKLSFDPLAFVNETPKKQIDILKDVVGVDFKQEDADRQRYYDERTEINRTIASGKARISGMSFHEDAPKELVLVNELMEKLDRFKTFNAIQESATHRREEIQEYIDKLEHDLKESKSDLASANKAMPLKNTEELETGIRESGKINDMVRENITYTELKKEIAKQYKQVYGLSESISDIDHYKTQRMEEVEFPVGGITFDSTGVYFNEIPFGQCSSAEQLRVSLGMGIALNPNLKVIIIKDGSLLDEANLKIISEMAKENEVQVWIERVGKGKECSLIIEDGEVE